MHMYVWLKQCNMIHSPYLNMIHSPYVGYSF